MKQEGDFGMRIANCGIWTKAFQYQQRKIRMKRTAQRILLLFFMGFLVVPMARADNEPPALNAGIEKLGFQLTSQVAAQYFEEDKRPVIKVVVFDFTDPEGNVTAGSRYVSTRIQLAFAKGLQFELLTPANFKKEGFVATAKTFSKNKDVRERMLDMIKADVYIFGTVAVEGSSSAVCDIKMWGLAPPFDQWLRVKPIQFESPNPWKLGFSPSGMQFFNDVVLKGVEGVEKKIKRENLGKVIFLSQPICDDLNLSWQIRSDGMVYDMRKESNLGSLRNRTGQVLQSRVKSQETLKELSYIISDASLVVKEQDGAAYRFEPYVLPEQSNYFFIPFSGNQTGLRFQYIWGKPGLSKRVSTLETGKGWKLHAALDDYENIMPVGDHIATATLTPVAESQYGSKRPRSDYVTRFKFSVHPGVNVYVVNYVYRRDRPEIFIRRLEIEAVKNVPIRSIKKITEVYRVYGNDR